MSLRDTAYNLYKRLDWSLLRRIPARLLTKIGIAVILCALVGTCSPVVSTLYKVQTRQQITMATVNSRTTYYLGPSGPKGFEYDLGKLFAQTLGVELHVLVCANLKQALDAVESGQAQFASGLSVTPDRQRQFAFTPAYLDVKYDVVFHTRQFHPRKVDELNGRLAVPAFSSTVEWLHDNFPGLEFKADPHANIEALLSQVANGKLDFTIAGKRVVKINQRFLPKLRVAFTLKHTTQQAWAFKQTNTQGLYKKAVAFIHSLKNSDQLAAIRKRNFGHIHRLGFVGGKTFALHVESRLPKWRKDFIKVGKKTGLDWRLLAATSYQESHWRADAVSPTKVRGMMMLTRSTAKKMGVKNRRDPLQSLSGGARYLIYLRKRLAKKTGKINPLDLNWMTLAAYNVGIGHVFDARRLASKLGYNPNSWLAVRAALIKLTHKRYFKHARHGYVRGHGAVDYVGNIRAYYDILLWMTSDTRMSMPNTLTEDTHETPPPPPTPESPLDISTPTL